MPPKKRGSMRNAAPKGRIAPTNVGLASTKRHRTRFDLKHTNKDRTVISLLDQLYTAATFGPIGSVGFGEGLVENVRRVPVTMSSAPESVVGIPAILPKLSSFARAYNRYRILRARVHYQSTCSASTNASVGVAIVPGFATTSPTLRDVAGYEAGVIGPAWDSFSSAWWTTHEDRLFFTDNASIESVPISIITVVESLASVKLSVGLFWLEMEVELVDIRPQPATIASLSTAQQTLSGDAPGTLAVPRFADILQMQGDFGWGDSAATRTTQVADTAVQIPSTGALAVGAANWLLDYYFDLGAAAVSSSRPADRPPDHWVTGDGQEEKQAHRGTRVFPEPWRNCRSRLLCAFHSQEEARAAQRAGFDPAQLARDLPMTAGDVVVSLNYQSFTQDSAVLPMYSRLFSSGTGAQELVGQHRASITDPGYFFWQVTPTGSETRVLSTDSSSVLQRINSLGVGGI